MKRLILFLIILFSQYYITKAQVAFEILNNSCNPNFVGEVNSILAGNIDGSNPGWDTPNMLLPQNAVQGCLVLVNDGTNIGMNDAYGHPTSQDACDGTTWTQDLTGKIAVYYRGACEFSLKAWNAQQRGAIGAILINHTGEPVEQGGGLNGPNVTIPIAMISEFNGSLLTACLDTVCTGIIGSIGRKAIVGNIFTDPNLNCSQDSNEVGVPNWLATIMPGNIIVQTNSEGYWGIDSLTAGNYTITINSTVNFSPSCATTQNFTVIHSDSITNAPSFGLVSNVVCSAPQVSINMPIIRPCTDSLPIYIQACNTFLGTQNITSATIEIKLDSLLTPIYSPLFPFVNLGDNIYSFNLGSLSSGDCVDFPVYTNVSCDAFIRQTLCMEAYFQTVDSCVYDTIPSPYTGEVMDCLLPWDNSNLSVDGWCTGDSLLYFTVTNTSSLGIGDMQCYTPVRLFNKGTLTMLDSILLEGGESKTYTVLAGGDTWRFEADQHPLHPGNSHPSVTIELCGPFSATWPFGYVNILPHDDADSFVDIFCGEVRSSYDPNIKTGYPTGVGTNHFIAPNGKIEYVIQFQNTGNDTAFTVTVRDTLDIDLDIFSVASGVSSHAYTFQMYGPRVLEWTFSNILLPDSTTDEPNSHGFVTFSVNQNPDLPNGTEINNSVGIYFDFNEPIITNTTSHIVNRDIYYLVSVNEIKNKLGESLYIYPNPTTSRLNLILPENEILNLSIYSVEGKLTETRVITQNTSIDVNHYKNGMYFIKATNEDGNIYQSKFIKE
jgi:uncharacterized repeat protein (TIGR01451 family)